MNNERQKLLKRLQICDFVLTEASMYLDTHPNNAMALEYFNKHNKMKKEILKEYVDKYGPITRCDNNNSQTWQWINNPWPWENMEDNNNVEL